MLRALSMEAFCLEISNFLYGEDSQIDRTMTNLLITNLVKKYIGQFEYTEEGAQCVCNEITVQCLPLFIAHPNVRSHCHIKEHNMKDLIATINSVILEDILDEMTWNELKSEINSKLKIESK